MKARSFSFRQVAWATVAAAAVGGCTEVDGGDVEDPPPACAVTTYRIEHVDLAATWGDASAMALDVDRDGDKDNKLGSLNATLTQVYGDWDPEPALDALLAAPAAGWMMKVERCAARVEVSVGVGGDADGDGVLEVADWGAAAVGEGDLAWGGVGVMPIGRIGAGAGAADGAGTGAADGDAADGDGADAGTADGDGAGGADGDGGWTPELGLAVALRPDARGLAATVGVGVLVTDELLAPVARFLSEALAAGDSRFAAGIDLDRDGVVSVAELRMADAVRTLLASDLDLTAPCGDASCYEPNVDGVADRISLGFSVRARPAPVE